MRRAGPRATAEAPDASGACASDTAFAKAADEGRVCTTAKADFEKHSSEFERKGCARRSSPNPAFTRRRGTSVRLVLPVLRVRPHAVSDRFQLFPLVWTVLDSGFLKWWRAWVCRPSLGTPPLSRPIPSKKPVFPRFPTSSRIKNVLGETPVRDQLQLPRIAKRSSFVGRLSRGGPGTPNPTKSDQIRPNPTKSDQIRPNPTKSDQIAPLK
jgi:hypothetical protein